MGMLEGFYADSHKSQRRKRERKTLLRVIHDTKMIRLEKNI